MNSPLCLGTLKTNNTNCTNCSRSFVFVKSLLKTLEVCTFEMRDNQRDEETIHCLTEAIKVSWAWMERENRWMKGVADERSWSCGVGGSICSLQPPCHSQILSRLHNCGYCSIKLPQSYPFVHKRQQDKLVTCVWKANDLSQFFNELQVTRSSSRTPWVISGEQKVWPLHATEARLCISWSIAGRDCTLCYDMETTCISAQSPKRKITRQAFKQILTKHQRRGKTKDLT